jgi:hypothetical protein
MLRHTSCVLVSILLASLLWARPAQAAPDERCFPETGFCISGPIRAYWERNGGLPIFGYPVSTLQDEDVEGRRLPVQWFERDRLEDHGAQGVLAGRLGARYLELNNTPWEYFPNTDTPAPGCQYVALTRQNLCGPYLRYWQQNGGLERFGYPITGEIYENVEGKKYRVVYFERRRMEIHADLPGSPILLGLLGRDVRALPEPLSRYPDCLRDALPQLRDVQIGKPLGCPSLAPVPEVPAATQAFERGVMLWTNIRNVPVPRFKPGVPDIIAFIQPGPTQQAFDDTWVAGQDPDTPPFTPPAAGLYAPWRSFGTVWAANPALRDAIGWATQPEAQARTADIQLFSIGLVMRVRETGVTYVLGNTNTPTSAQIVNP